MAMEVVPVKLPPELKRAMIAQAKREGMSRSAFMRKALIFYMQELERSSEKGRSVDG
jgi:metal-responsive CopG/Arc/MetJ family transcriptional regulator